MTIRAWLYGKLSTSPIAEKIGGLDQPRVFAKKTMTSSIELHPYVVYKLGYNANEAIAEDVLVERQFLQIWVHDYSDGESGDYELIDLVIEEIKQVLHNATSKEHGVILCTYLETSQDLSDETLNTVMKYIRFQVETKETS